jgi:cytochrome c-type biogenesis protein CcmH
MSRRVARLPPLAAAVLLALAVGGAVALGADQAGIGRTQAETVAAELRCPDCEGLSVADSPSVAAAEIRRQIAALLAEGATPDEVRAHFVARYGEWILLVPSAPWAWAIPFVVVTAGGLALVAWLSGTRSSGAEREVAPPSAAGTIGEAERRRAREEAEALDA